MCAVRRDTGLPEAVYQVPQRELLQPRLPKSTLQDAQERVRCAGSGVCAGACTEDGEPGAAEGERERKGDWEVGSE